MAKTEHAAVCPIDHRLDHLSHSPSTYFSLPQVLKKKKKKDKKKINNNKENHLISFHTNKEII